jgi:hypothetical protein
MIDESTGYENEWSIDEVYHFAKRYNELVALAESSSATIGPYPYPKARLDGRERSPDKSPCASGKRTESLHEALVRALCGNDTWIFGYFMDERSFTDRLRAWEDDLKCFSGYQELPCSVEFNLLKRMNHTMETIRSVLSALG